MKLFFVLAWPKINGLTSLYSTQPIVPSWLPFKSCYKCLIEPEPVPGINQTLFSFRVVSSTTRQSHPSFAPPFLRLYRYAPIPEYIDYYQLLHISIVRPWDYDILSQIIFCWAKGKLTCALQLFSSIPELCSGDVSSIAPIMTSKHNSIQCQMFPRRQIVPS